MKATNSEKGKRFMNIMAYENTFLANCRSRVVTALAGGALVAAPLVSLSLGASQVSANALTDAITSGKANGDIRIRYEDVENGDVDSDGLTIRSRIGYTTGNYKGFSAKVEFEDARDMFGIDDENGLIPDSENTEVDLAFIQYKGEGYTATVGRQVVTLDGHRHVGHVGWRQDRQTFDAARLVFTPIKDLKIDISHLWRRNRINSPAFADIRNANDWLINASYQTPLGKLVAYNYSLSREGGFDETDTFGASFAGKTKLSDDFSVLYALEYASQDNATADVDTDYTWIELGAAFAGVTAKIGQEVLGSDDGVENFQTPLATVHKFNGWADVFLGGSLFGTIDGGNGLEDTYLSVGGKVAGVKLAAVYHEYESDEASTDLGDEINLLAAKKFGKHYNAGIKYADYSAGDIGNDKKIFWLWTGMTF